MLTMSNAAQEVEHLLELALELECSLLSIAV